jgi:hypothetical protein
MAGVGRVTFSYVKWPQTLPIGDKDEVIATLIGHLTNTLSPAAAIREESERFLFGWFQSEPFDFVVRASASRRHSASDSPNVCHLR